MIWILALEPIDTRYTRQWHEHLPNMIGERTKQPVHQIDGEQVTPKPSPGAFLDFAATNIWKSTQLATFMKCIQEGEVKKNDYVLVTDAWNPAILQIKYTTDLLGLDIKIGAIWHSGSYDPEDFLGRACGGKPWARNTEQALFDAIDDNFFATEAHIELFKKTYPETKGHVRTGLPFEFFPELFKPYSEISKRDLILFPHRLAPEKQVHVFKELANRLPQYEYVICQEKELTKDEYHTLLGQSKIVFSANLQETFGISVIEGVYCNSIPFVPDRLSYPEIFNACYPSEITMPGTTDIEQVATRIENLMTNWEPPTSISPGYIEADVMYNAMAVKGG